VLGKIENELDGEATAADAFGGQLDGAGFGFASQAQRQTVALSASAISATELQRRVDTTL
jgi:hypothetical protein